jgi:hypothetical protein
MTYITCEKYFPLTTDIIYYSPIKQCVLETISCPKPLNSLCWALYFSLQGYLHDIREIVMKYAMVDPSTTIIILLEELVFFENCCSQAEMEEKQNRIW